VFRSSIFSFDSLQIKATVPKALLVAVSVLVLLDFAVARREWIWAFVPRSPSGVFDVLEDNVVVPAQDPSIVLFGSSRVRDAVAPRLLEEELGLREGSVLNLAMTAGNPFDSLVFYRRHREKLSGARLIIIGVEFWDFNAHGINERDRRFANLADRLQLFDRKKTPALLVGWLWRTWDAKAVISRFIDIETRWLLGERDIMQQMREPPIEEDGRVEWRTDEPATATAEEPLTAVADRALSNYSAGYGRRRQVQHLVDLAHEDGVPVLVVLFPMRTEFAEYVRAAYPHAYAHFHQQLRSIKGARIRIYETERDAHLPQECFDDYGHVNKRGSELMTSEVAVLLRDWYPELFSRGIRDTGA